MANQKDLMKLGTSELIALGAQSGLTFHAGMKKSHMVQQLSASAASGWMETNAELMGGTFEDTGEVYTESFGDSSMISDAAHVAQMLSGAGYTEAFHNAMNGPQHHVEAVHAYMERLGVNTDDVWMHMPKANPNLPQSNFNMLNAYMRDTLQGHQDIMPEIPGHYTGDIMAEYSTNRGNIADSYNYMAHMYVDREQYASHEQYARDISRVAKRLEQELPSSFKEIGYTAASNVGNKSAPHISYMDALPQIGSPTIVSGISHPRQPLNASGLPLGSYGSGINPEYSLTASLTGGTGWSEPSKALYSSISEAVKSAAKVYSGKTGMNNTRHEVSDRDMIMDSATRYADLEEARSGYANLKSELADEPSYSASSVRAILENTYDKMDAEPIRIPEMKSASHKIVKDAQSTSTEFTAQLGEATNWNSARMRREELAIANMDSAGFRDVADYGTKPASKIQYHDLVQGTPEWHDMRNRHDITGSTVGVFLGNSAISRPWEGLIDKLGLARGDKSKNKWTEETFAKGHEAEEWARPRVAKEFGFDIKEVGAITNSDFPGMMYSPDGLIGDDALWEHKHPWRVGKTSDIAAGEHPDYMDQIQFGMLLSGRSRTLFSQTVHGKTTSEWIEKDDGWYERNKTRLDSISGRLAAGRKWLEENPGEMDDKERIAEVRKVMTGDGLWKDVRQRSNRNYDPNAGTSADPFVKDSRLGKATVEDSGYVPNFVMHEQNFPATVGDGSNDSMALSVKRGILAAQEENKQKGISGVDADFDGKQDSSVGWNQERFDAANGGGSGGGGGRGYFSAGGNFSDDFGKAGGALASGIAGGSLSSASNGVMQALMATPAGRLAAVGIGAIQIGNEAADFMNDYIGQSLDAGVANPNEYSSMSQGLEMLGLNSQQANRLNQTTHSAYNTMLNGDPSAAVNIVRGSRGLLTIGDIRSTGGDPVALARIMQERGKERGWSQARIAGAAQMAGLDGMARAFDRTEYSHERAGSVVESGRNSDFAEGMAQSEMLQVERAQLLPGYNVPQSVLSHGAALFEAGSTAAGAANSGYSQARQVAANVYDFIANEESGGKEYNKDGTRVTSPTGARGIMQVLPSTARDPGYGIKPSDGSPEDDARVGREYYDAMYKRFGGDHEKAMAAYTDGAGTVGKAVDKFGMDWLSAVPAQAQKRVKAYRDWAKSSEGLDEGATGFTRNGISYGQTQTTVNVKIDAKVNNQTASATVAVPGGQTVTQQMNMHNGAQQRR